MDSVASKLKNPTESDGVSRNDGQLVIESFDTVIVSQKGKEMQARKTTQEDIIASHLDDAPITQREAAEKYNIWRLAAVVHRLREEGMEIETEMREAANGSRYALYWLKHYTKLQCPECGAIFDIGRSYYRGVNLVECPCCGADCDMEHDDITCQPPERDWREEMREAWLMDRIKNYR